jgi:predicted dehydrogenase
MTLRFAAVGVSHYHVFSMTDALLSAGAQLVSVLGSEPERVQEFMERYPQAKLAESVDRILNDESIHVIISAEIPDQRAPLGMQAMQHDKDYLCAKPGFTSIDQLDQARRVQGETGRIYGIYFGERFGNGATVKAGEMVQAGVIGRVVNTIGIGPHRLLGHTARPDWSFQRSRFGGIINDLASHQIDQFLFFTGCIEAQIMSARVANVRFRQFPDFEDFGELLIQGGDTSGYIRVDWLTPDGLSAWGDVRLFIQGTEGYIEVRKNCDIGGREGGNHLFVVDQSGVHTHDCSNHPLPFGAQFVADVFNRTETAVQQEHTFTASRLALQAQQLAYIHR